MKPRKEITLDPSKSRDLRTLPAIREQAAILDRLLADKTIEELSVQQLIDIGLTYNEKSDYQNARKFFNFTLQRLALYPKALTSDEKYISFANCYYGFANVERESGNDEKAINWFEQARAECEKISKDFDGYFKLKYDIERNLGIALLKKEAFEDAAKCFKTAMEIATQFKQTGLVPAAMSYYGLSLVLSGAHRFGLIQLDNARVLYPVDKREMSMDWASHRYHMGRAYQVIGDHIYAISEFKESLRLRLQITNSINSPIGNVYFHSRVGDSHAGLGHSYLALGDFKEAEKWLHKALENYQTLKNARKVQEIEQALETITSIVLQETKLALQQQASQTKYLRYVAGAASVAMGIGFFAYRLYKGSSNAGSVNEMNQTPRP